MDCQHLRQPWSETWLDTGQTPGCVVGVNLTSHHFTKRGCGGLRETPSLAVFRMAPWPSQEWLSGPDTWSCHPFTAILPWTTVACLAPLCSCSCSQKCLYRVNPLGEESLSLLPWLSWCKSLGYSSSLCLALAVVWVASILGKRVGPAPTPT